MLLDLLWLSMLVSWVWRQRRLAASQTTPAPATSITKRSKEPTPFVGRIHKPYCDACEHAIELHPQAPSSLPPLLTCTRGRQRTIDTQPQFCPDHECTYYGWVGRGNIRANGHPGGKPWRQLQCVACQRYFQETHGTVFHAKRVSPQMLVWAVGTLAEGRGIRAVAPVCEVDPNTVLQWLVEAADQLQAFSRNVLHDRPVTQVQLAELYALVSAVKAGQVECPRIWSTDVDVSWCKSVTQAHSPALRQQRLPHPDERPQPATAPHQVWCVDVCGGHRWWVRAGTWRSKAGSAAPSVTTTPASGVIGGPQGPAAGRGRQRTPGRSRLDTRGLARQPP